MKLSFSTLGCPNWTMEQIVANATRLGFDGVELRGIGGQHIGADEPPASRARIRQMFADAGVRIACIMGYSAFTMDDAAERSANAARIVQVVQLARDIGCPLVRIFGGAEGPLPREEYVRRAAESISRITPAAERLGVRLALETHDGWRHGADAAALVRAVDSPALGVCWDIANASLIEPIDVTFAEVKDHIIHVHFKDCAEILGQEVPTLMGKGQVDLPKALTLLRDAGYHGWLSFEWEKKWVPEIEEPEVAFPQYIKYTTELMAKLGVKRG